MSKGEFGTTLIMTSTGFINTENPSKILTLTSCVIEDDLETLKIITEKFGSSVDEYEKALEISDANKSHGLTKHLLSVIDQNKFNKNKIEYYVKNAYGMK
jgi:hypothetical protein